MRVWRVDCHAPAGLDSPPPVTLPRPQQLPYQNNPATTGAKSVNGISMLGGCNLQAGQGVGIWAVFEFNKVYIPILSRTRKISRNVLRDFYVLFLELVSTTSIHGIKERAIFAFAECFTAETECNIVSIQEYALYMCAYVPDQQLLTSGSQTHGFTKFCMAPTAQLKLDCAFSHVSKARAKRKTRKAKQVLLGHSVVQPWRAGPASPMSPSTTSGLLPFSNASHKLRSIPSLSRPQLSPLGLESLRSPASPTRLQATQPQEQQLVQDADPLLPETPSHQQHQQLAQEQWDSAQAARMEAMQKQQQEQQQLQEMARALRASAMEQQLRAVPPQVGGKACGRFCLEVHVATRVSPSSLSPAGDLARRLVSRCFGGDA
eukprot:1159443-Pelagomonas_calceolata.AAC.8